MIATQAKQAANGNGHGTPAENDRINGVNMPALHKLMDDVKADPRNAATAWGVTTRWAGGTVSETQVAGYEIGGRRVRKDFKIRADEPLELEVWAERLARHRRGATADLCTSVSVGGEEVWRGRSTYLGRGATASEGAPESDASVSVGDTRPVATWRVPDDAGRRYAKVSGDVNPIHLSALTAKAFGFKRAIAHGMWVKARVLAALSGRLPDAFSVDVGFQKPLYLPSTVALSTAEAGGGWDVAVRNAINGTGHLVGTIRPS